MGITKVLARSLNLKRRNRSWMHLKMGSHGLTPTLKPTLKRSRKNTRKLRGSAHRSCQSIMVQAEAVVVVVPEATKMRMRPTMSCKCSVLVHGIRPGFKVCACTCAAQTYCICDALLG